MATDVIAPSQDDQGGDENDKPRSQPPEYRRETGSRGFFHIYKSGQGYWTRMGTAGGAALIGLLLADFFYTQLPPRIDYLSNHHTVALWIALGFLVIYGVTVYWFMNKATTADFLIATDSEMKKVNWTSRKELIGSTKVVILFMFLIAFMLFAIDIIFGYVFHWIGVLKSAPF